MSTSLFGVLTSQEQLSLPLPSTIDGIELRLDLFDKIDLPLLETFIKSCPFPVILTLRRADQGGSFKGTEEERFALLEKFCALKPAYVDLEYDISLPFRKKLFEAFPQIIFLSSYHNFSHTPQNLNSVYDQVYTPYAHLYKIALMASSSLDALRLLSFVYSHPQRGKIIGISLGELGTFTRILAPLAETPLMYAPLTLSQMTAPGQLIADELQEVYRFRGLSPKTKVYALIGDPVDQSLGHLIHNAVFDEAKKEAVYLKIRVKTEELSSFFSLISSLPFCGLSVTMPHKEAVLSFLHKSSAEVQAIGACNTLHLEEGKWVGYNTDGEGALDVIEEGGKVLGKHLLFLGAGGAAKAILYEALKRGARATVVNRTASKAIALAQSLSCQGGGWDLLPQLCREGYEILINCIPTSEELEEEWILPDKIAMDIVYVPKMTSFLTRAAEKGCQLLFGYEMFLRQAVLQQQIWSIAIERKAIFKLMEKEVSEALRERL